MTRKTSLMAGAVIGLSALLTVPAPALAANCKMVKAAGHASSKDKATARALKKFQHKRARAGGRMTQISNTTCSKSAGLYTCKVKAVVCP